MGIRKGPTPDSFDDEWNSMHYLQQGDTGTETIDLKSLCAENVSTTGSFNFKNEIWATTFGKLIQALPTPVLLIDQFGNVMVANQACRKISKGYEKILGKPFSALCANPSAAEQSEFLISTVLSTRKTTSWEALLRVDQKEIWARLTFRAIRMADQRFLLAPVEDLSLEKALRESEERYRQMFEGNWAVKLIIDPETSNIVDANRAAEAFYGYSRDELKQLKITDINILPPKRVFEDMGKVKAAEMTYLTFQHRLRSRQIRDVEVYSSPIDVQGKKLLYSIIHDITERRQAEEALKDSYAELERRVEERTDDLKRMNEKLLREVADRRRIEEELRKSEDMLKTTLSASPIGISLGTYDRRLQWSNEAWLNMFGYENENDCLGQSFSMFYQSQEEFDRAGNDLYTRLATRRVQETDAVMMKKDGNTFDAHIRIGAIDPSALSKGTIVTVTDISDRKRVEKELKTTLESLKQSEERMRLVIESSPIGIRIVQHGMYVYVNPSIVRMFGYASQDEVVGLPVEALYEDESKKLILQRVADRAAGKRVPDHYEATALSKTGKPFEVETWGAEINYLGRTSYLAFVIDVSEAKHLRSQLLQSQKMEAIGTLAGGIAHDFNNLLTVILGYSELIISEKDKSDPEYDDLTKIIHSARTGGDIVKQILAFSRKTEAEPRPINLNKQVEQLRKLLSRLIPKTIDVQIDLDPKLPVVNADPSQIDQVLMNLAVNARDAMPNGGKLIIQTRSLAPGGDHWHGHVGYYAGCKALLTVSDTGIGIDKAARHRIFEPFYTTKKVGEGTGLGLAMVYGIVKSHGGHITCESTPGAGTTFHICLPAHTVEAETDVVTSHEIEAVGFGTILLVDDEELVRDLGRRILEKAGYTVIVASNGQEAVEIYRQTRHGVSLLILDLIMPVMDGRECLDQILRLDPQAKVLIASGHFPDGTMKAAVESGAKGIIKKPYDIAQMIQAVREILQSGLPK